ncbi:hypothetical protein K491DRAFT_326071 [Lophiostoma macrostomum CBS 122681]|uniref:THO complex subunit 2 n=1 Tax=Lophiostoma macrostomum CBS 122681 TaxID=1314788 RepID=A0A6A6TFK7_9PLEO|nr:hypothetical protein K491DRAFT_326071 [Lophiostoma macrostomum CBS 122681]
MAPGGKRKRGDGADGPSRPSPHRPQNLPLAHAQQQSQQQNNARGGGRRGSRTGSRGGFSAPNSPSVAHPSPSAMSPPSTLPSSSKPQFATPANPPPTQSHAVLVCDSNDFLTQERVGKWTASGRAALVDDAVRAVARDDPASVALVFEELVRASIDQTFGSQELGSTVRDILAAAPVAGTLDMTSLFLSTVSLLTETEIAQASVKLMLETTVIPPQRLREELESDQLVALNLVRPTFSKMAIRKATNTLYKQSNYNLLREEPEGYSKLVTEYFTTVHNEPPNVDVVTETFQRVTALVGAFDLDVGRVLDITLDVFANLLVKHTEFFVKLLRISSWWPENEAPHGIQWEEPEVSSLPQWALPGSYHWYYNDNEKEAQLQLREQRDKEFWKTVEGPAGIKAFFELGARRITGGVPSFQSNGAGSADRDESSGKKKDELSDFEKTQQWSEEWMKETKTLPPSGNRTAAQLLGFKLRFYASDARDAHDTLPDNLIHLAALLIKIGFISLADLYPHLYPLDEDMSAHKDKLMKAKQEREKNFRRAPENALAMAGSLPDDMPPAPSSVTRLRASEIKGSPKPETDRGTPPRAASEPKDKLPEPVDQKAALLRSLLCIGAIPEALFILGRFPWLLDVYPDLLTYLLRIAHHSISKVYENSRTLTRQETAVTPKKGPMQASARTGDFIPRRTLRWAKLEERDAGDGVDYRFYWKDWADNVPVCQNVDDVVRFCNTFLAFAGLEFGKDASLLTKLLRIGRMSLREDPSTTNMNRWKTLSITQLAPALTFSGENPGTANEAWDLFKLLDTASRYTMYASWFEGPASRKPAVKAKFSELDTLAKRVLDRTTITNAKRMQPQIAKLSLACPGFIFNKFLDELSLGKDNMTDILVRLCDRLSPFAYDCLNWAFVSGLRKPRATMQANGMNTSLWLQHLTEFIAKAYKEHVTMDPTPVLQLVATRFVEGNTSMLDLLDNFIRFMASMSPTHQRKRLEISGGPLLHATHLDTDSTDNRNENKMAGKRFVGYLKKGGLMSLLLVALAQEVERYPFRKEFEEANTPLKVIASNLDKLRSTFAQLLDLLRTFLPVEEFGALIPDIIELLSVYHIEPALAFTICRAKLSEQIALGRSERKVDRERTTQLHPGSEGDVVMSGTEDTLHINGAANSANNTHDQSGTQQSDVHMKDDDTSIEIDKSPTQEDSSNSLILPGYPQNPLVQEIAEKLKTSMPEVYGDHICLDFFITFWELSPLDIFPALRGGREVYQKVINSLKGPTFRNRIPGLKQEEKGLLNNFEDLKTSLREEMHHWFDGQSELLHDTILQDCFLPRILMSYHDAKFGAAMLWLMHDIGVPGFRTMKLLDQLFKQKVLTNIIFMSTPDEATNFGTFLKDILQNLEEWHRTEKDYIRFAQGQNKSLPGFARAFNVDRSPATFLDFEDFRRLLFKWHSQLFRALEMCFKDREYMHMNNAKEVLLCLKPAFPRVDTMGDGLRQVTEAALEVEQDSGRADVKVFLQSLSSLFKGQKWITAQAFHSRNVPHQAQVSNAQNSPVVPARTEHGRAQVPATSSTARLDASAPEFSPSGEATNGVLTSQGNGSIEDEDGEVKDQVGISSTGAAPASIERAAPAPPAQPREEERNLQTNREANISSTPVEQSASIAARIEGRGERPSLPNQSSRVPHTLPPRPEAQPLRSRPGERPSERQTDFTSRHDARSNVSPVEYPRPNRTADAQREFVQDRREMSPGRRLRGRTPDRREPTWGRDARDIRESRDFHDDRAMRPPVRDVRSNQPVYNARDGRDPRDMRDSRDLRDQRDLRDGRELRETRDRLDHRGPPPQLDGRGRLHSTPSSSHPLDGSTYRRDVPPLSQQGPDRNGNLNPRQPINKPPANASITTPDRSAPANDRTLINPERAALINDDRGRSESFRSEREDRGELGSRPQSPRRGPDRPPPSYPGRNETARDHRDDRNDDRVFHDRTPPHTLPPARDRRDEAPGLAPTGPRGGRNDASSSSRVSRDMFMPSHVPSRASTHQVQDPNYGRLNPPNDTIPSGPRGMTSSTQHRPTSSNNTIGFAPDRREPIRRESTEMHPHQHSPQAAPAAPVANRAGVHPSRLSIINSPSSSQTDVVNAPSGPRGSSLRVPQGPASTPTNARGPPTGPALTERNARNQDRSALHAINSVLNSEPTQVRGRGGTRANGLGDPTSIPSPGGSSSHPNTPNPLRSDGPQARGGRPDYPANRIDNRSFDDGRHEPRGRRNDRMGRQRSRSPERNDRRPDERSTRNGPVDRNPRNDEQDKINDRERGPGRDRRPGDRDSNRRERDREAEHPPRDVSDRRERLPRDENRNAGRGEGPGSRRGMPSLNNEPAGWSNEGRGDPRAGDHRGRAGPDRKDDRGERRRDDARDTRGGGSGGRKRDRGQEEAPHGDSKRTRRSNAGDH